MHSTTIQDDLCVICSQNYTKDHSHTALKCGHAFGRSCIVEWRKTNSSCPVCHPHFAIPKDPPDTSLITRIKKQVNLNKLPYCLLAGTSYLYNPNTVEIACWNILVGAISLGTYGAIRVCTPIVNLIYGYLGCEPLQPMQLREMEPHVIVCCSAIIAGSIASKLTINPQHEHLL